MSDTTKTATDTAKGATAGTPADSAISQVAGGRKTAPPAGGEDSPVDKKKDDDSSLKIKIQLDIDVEIHLTARIKGDITIGLLSK